MLKQLWLMTLLSLILVFTFKYYILFLTWLSQSYYWLLAKLGLFIPSNFLSHIALNLIGLLVFPLAIAYIPAGIYWLLIRRQLPYSYLNRALWYGWLTLATVLTLHH